MLDVYKKGYQFIGICIHVLEYISLGTPGIRVIVIIRAFPIKSVAEDILHW